MGSRPGTAVSMIILFFLATINGVILPDGSSGISAADEVFVQSNTGMQLIDEAATTTFFGTYVESFGCKLGSLLWVGDLNNDGIDDLSYNRNDIFPDQMETLFGSEEWYHSTVGLSSIVPDLELDQISVKGMESGDLNGDGYNDLIVGSYPLGYILWGPDFKMSGSTSVQIGSMDSTFNFRYDDFITVSDLDDDGISELIGGQFGYEGYPYINPPPDHVVIRWGDSGNTTIISPNTFIRFGCSVESGDIDGDGYNDLIIGSSNHGFGGRNRAGAVYIIFNASRLKGNDTIYSEDVVDVLITGTDPYDQFGWSIRLFDLNDDGKMDIIAGAPGADGAGNDKSNCGEIMVFHGRDNRSFPKEMNAENHADIVVIGNKGSDNQKPAYSGDRLGEMFELPDMNGDATPEVVIPYPGRNLDPIDGIPRSSAGAVSVYPLRDIFPSSGGITMPSYPSSEFHLEGVDIEDGIGWQMKCGDINGDEMDDLVISAPAADGPENSIPRAGEIYVVTGSGLSLREMEIHGEGASSPIVFAGGGWVNFDLSYIDTYGADEVVNGTLTIDPLGANISIHFEGGNFRIDNDDFDCAELDDGSSGLITDGIRGVFRIRMRLDPFFPARGPVDVRYRLDDRLGIEAEREYEGSVIISKDMEFRGDLNVTVNGDLSCSDGRWIRPDDIIGFSGPRIVFADQPSRPVPFGFPNVRLDAGVDIHTELKNNDGWELSAGASDVDSIDFRISLAIPGDSIPPGLDRSYIPGTGEPITHTTGIDRNPPDPAGNLSIHEDGDVIENGCIKRLFNISWDGGIGGTWDGGESGIREYTINVGGSNNDVASSSGGLFGTYYDGSGFNTVKLERVDPGMEFTRSDWGGFGPDPTLMRPHSFSVRWHGWIAPDRTEDYTFMVEGSGETTVLLDGDPIIDRIDIRGGSASRPVFLISGMRYSIEIYFRNNAPESWFRFRSKFSYYPFEEIPSDQLWYPSLEETISTDLAEGPLNVTVTAVDWVDRRSGSVDIMDVMDLTPPDIMLLGYRSWVNTTSPTILVSAYDHEISGYEGSGIDPLSMTYSLKRPDGQWELPTDRGRRILENGSFMFKLDLPPNYKGEIRFECSDMDGNEKRTDGFFLGVDIEPPVLNLLSPDIFNYLYGLDHDFTVDVNAGLRSGLDENSGKFRYHQEGSNWSEWCHMNISSDTASTCMQGNLHLPGGNVDIQFGAGDLAGNTGLSEVYGIILIDPADNEPPVPHISNPVNNSVIGTGATLILNAQGTRDDGFGDYQMVRLTWFSDVDGYLGSGNIIEIDPGKGTHNITLFADDGSPGHNISTSIVVHVRDPVYGDVDEDPVSGGGPKDTMIIALIVIISVALVLIAGVFYAFHQRTGGIDTSLGIKQRTDDDDRYDESIDRSDTDLGYEVETGKRIR